MSSRSKAAAPRSIAPAPISRLKRIYRYHFLLKAERRDRLGVVLRGLLAFADREEISRRSVVVDVDWFKQYNDTYGHQAGDHCLRQVASVMQAAADSERITVGRMGGEAFGLLYIHKRYRKKSNPHAAARL